MVSHPILIYFKICSKNKYLKKNYYLNYTNLLEYNLESIPLMPIPSINRRDSFLQKNYKVLLYFYDLINFKLLFL